MSRSRVTVHHFVANHTTRRYGPHPTSTLIGVDYWAEFPPDAELPFQIGQLDLFTRFYLTNARRTSFGIEVWWLDAEGFGRDRMDVFGPFEVNFDPDDTVRDVNFRLKAIPIRRIGLYAVRLLAKRRRSVSWPVIAETHFYVERS